MNNVTNSLENIGTPNTQNPNPWWKNPSVMIILGVLYCLSPLDVVPDISPGIGWMDDIGVIAYVIKTVMEQRKNNA